MGCGCQNRPVQIAANESFTVNENCPFTLSELTGYKERLYCIKSRELYTDAQTTEATINSYLGIVTSAIYYPSDFCYFQPSLEIIKTFIENLDLSICNEL